MHLAVRRGSESHCVQAASGRRGTDGGLWTVASSGDAREEQTPLQPRAARTAPHRAADRRPIFGRRRSDEPPVPPAFSDRWAGVGVDAGSTTSGGASHQHQLPLL